MKKKILLVVVLIFLVCGFIFAKGSKKVNPSDYPKLFVQITDKNDDFYSAKLLNENTISCDVKEGSIIRIPASATYFHTSDKAEIGDYLEVFFEETPKDNTLEKVVTLIKADDTTNVKYHCTTFTDEQIEKAISTVKADFEAKYPGKQFKVEQRCTSEESETTIIVLTKSGNDILKWKLENNNDNWQVVSSTTPAFNEKY